MKNAHHGFKIDFSTFLGHLFFFIYDWYLFICSTFPKLFCMPYIFANLDLGSAEFRLKFLSISLSFISSSSSGTCNTQNSFSETIASFSQYHTQAACLRDRRAVKITAKNHLSPILKKDKDTVSLPDNALHLSSTNQWQKSWSHQICTELLLKIDMENFWKGH